MNLYGYVGGDPVNWVDPKGLKKFCVPMDSFSYTNTNTNESDPIWGPWVYSHFIRGPAYGACMSLWYRDSRIDVTTTYTKTTVTLHKCWETDECGRLEPTYEYRSEETDTLTDSYSKAGSRENDWRLGGITAVGEGVKDGGGCSSAPGFWKRKPGVY